MARDESELEGSHRLPGANVWILGVFTQFIIHVVFCAKRDAIRGRVLADSVCTN